MVVTTNAGSKYLFGRKEMKWEKKAMLLILVVEFVNNTMHWINHHPLVRLLDYP